jgi:GNAT superfamily N-acetyltransferase
MNEQTLALDITFLTPEEIEHLKYLSHGVDGYMEMTLDCCLIGRKSGKHDFTADVILHRIDGVIVGWAILQDLLYRHENYLDMSIYVSIPYRGQGIASAILHFITDTYKTEKISVWIDNPKNRGLYKKFVGDTIVAFDSEAYAEDGSYKHYDFNK